MALTRASLNILLQIQKVFPSPLTLVCNPSKIELLPCLVFQPLKPFYTPSLKYLWTLNKWVLLILNICAFGRFLNLIWNWKHSKDFEQVCYYILLFAISQIGIEACKMLEHYDKELSYLFMQRFKMVPHKHHCKSDNILNLLHALVLNFKLKMIFITGNSKSVISKTLEISTYEIALTFFAFPLIFGLMPLFRNYDVLQLILRSTLGTFVEMKRMSTNIILLIRIISCIFTLLITFHGTFAVLTTMLIAVILLEAIRILFLIYFTL